MKNIPPCQESPPPAEATDKLKKGQIIESINGKEFTR
jgi:hypothetical protein